MAADNPNQRRAIHIVLDSPYLTPAQARHVEQLGYDFVRGMSDKYTKGQREHGGNLFDKSILFLIDAAIDEAYDHWTYLKTLRDRLTKLVSPEVLNRDDNQQLPTSESPR